MSQTASKWAISALILVSAVVGERLAVILCTLNLGSTQKSIMSSVVCPIYPDFRYRRLIRTQRPPGYAAEEENRIPTPAKNHLLVV
jgi:hypothetical protein